MPRILVVDDTAANRELAAAILESAGYEVTKAASGVDALESVRVDLPDLVLLDVRMPEMDGFAACHALRQLESTRDVPIVFLTALDDDETHRRALASGADDFLTKPLRTTELLIRVRSLLRLREATRELAKSYEVVRLQRDALADERSNRERLAAFLVHDLKNPIGRIQLAGRMLPSGPDFTVPLETIDTAARTLQRMVDDLLDVARAEARPLGALRRPTELAALCSDAIAAVEPFARKRMPAVAVSLELDGPRTLQLDADLLRRVLVNLLDNAVRHAAAGGSAVLRARCDGHDLELCVDDDGPGIPVDAREAVFDRFARLHEDEQVSSRAGHGVGLSFCKSAVESHGGAIAVVDGPAGRGCTVVVRIPIDG